MSTQCQKAVHRFQIRWTTLGLYIFFIIIIIITSHFSWSLIGADHLVMYTIWPSLFKKVFPSSWHGASWTNTIEITVLYNIFFLICWGCCDPLVLMSVFIYKHWNRFGKVLAIERLGSRQPREQLWELELEQARKLRQMWRADSL